MLSIGQVLELAELMPDRYRALVLVATFGCRRSGEGSALQRQDLDVAAIAPAVTHQLATYVLMARMGHDSPRAALIYQHRTSEADQAIAQAVNEQLEAEQRAAEEKRCEDEDDDSSAA